MADDSDSSCTSWSKGQVQTSFLTIGGIWAAHHGIFRRLRYANQRLMVLNQLLLMTVSSLPFATKLMAEAIHDEGAARAVAVLCGGTPLVISLLLTPA